MVRDKQELWETAVHEAGHTLLNILQDPAHTMPLRQVTIVARGEGCMGLTSYTQEKEIEWKRGSYFSWMVSAFGGLLAEKIVLGTQTSGVGSDISKVSKIARSMVMRYGMTSDVVPISYDLESYWGRGSEWGPQTNDMLDNEIRKVAKEAYDRGEELLKANVDKIEKLAHALVERETLTAKEVYELFDMPVREIKKIDERVLGRKNEASS